MGWMAPFPAFHTDDQVMRVTITPVEQEAPSFTGYVRSQVACP